jgi:hypothetical protein
VLVLLRRCRCIVDVGGGGKFLQAKMQIS